MENDSIILQGTTTEQLVGRISEIFQMKIEALKKDLNIQQPNDELLTREQACDFLQIDPSTLWAWEKRGKVTSYGISGNRRYYKRSELMEALKPINKK